MSLLVMVTFDLHGAQSEDYRLVKRKLSAFRLEKQIRSRGKNTPTRLPANTFAAKFAGKWSKKNAHELRDHLRERVCEAITSLHLSATVFVAVGDRWAWGKRIVGPSPTKRRC